MNATQEVREQYKQAARTYIEHINLKYRRPGSENFFQGKMSGLDVALSCLGVNSDEIREMYNTCEEEVRNEQEEREHDRIHQAATDAANQIEREKEQEQEELDAIERPASQTRVEAEQ